MIMLTYLINVLALLRNENRFVLDTCVGGETRHSLVRMCRFLHVSDKSARWILTHTKKPEQNDDAALIL